MGGGERERDSQIIKTNEGGYTVPQQPCGLHTGVSTQYLAHRGEYNPVGRDAGLPECSEHDLCSTEGGKTL